MKPKVQILLSTYNGEMYLNELLKSVFGQIDVEISLLVRDDGSADKTIHILEEWSQNYPVRLIEGENVGYAASFWKLVIEASGSDYYAFCDQDDLWHTDKLISAVRKISSMGHIPILYTSNVDTIDNDMNLLSHNAFPFSGVQNFKRSLLRSVLPGCTFVFNDMLLYEMKKYDKLVISHDWLAYIIASAIGTVIYDYEPKINYRIHEGNTFGTQTKLRKIYAKWHNFFWPKYPNGRSVVAANIYDTYKNDMKEDDREIAFLFGNYRSRFKYMIKLFQIKEFRNIILYILMLLHKA